MCGPHQNVVGMAAKARSPLVDALSWCRSIFFFDPLIIAYTAVMGSVSLLTSFFDRDGRRQHGVARAWSRMILKTSVPPVRVTGLENVDAAEPRVYIVNHISALDIPVLYVNLPFSFRIVVKKELFLYPFIGWHLRRSGQLPIDRSNPSASIRSLKTAIDCLRRGTSLVIFPEGGRSTTGEVQPFLSGASYVAIKAHVDIVPLAIVGTYEILPMKHFHIRPGPIELFVGHRISTAGLGLHDIDSLTARSRSAIEDMYYAHSKVLDPRRPAAAGSD